MAKISEKTVTSTIFYFSVSPPNYKNWAMYVINATISCTMVHLVQYSLKCSNLVLLEKNLKNKDFTYLTQVFKLLVWVPKLIKTFKIVAQWVNTCLQFDLK